MKRFLLAAALVVGCNLGIAGADYIIIKIDLNKLPSENTQPNMQPGASGGPGKGFGDSGSPGSGSPGIGAPGMGVKGKGKGKGGAGGLKGGGVQGGGIQGGGSQGSGSGLPGGVSGGGSSGGFPGGGSSGFPGGGQSGSSSGSSPGMQPENEYPPMYVYACIEVKTKPVVIPASQAAPSFFRINHKLGKQVLIPNPNMPHPQFPMPFIQVLYYEGSSIGTKFYQKRNEVIPKDGKTNDVESTKRNILILAEWALQRGMIKEFNETIDELKKFDAKHPVVAAVEKVRADLKRLPKTDDPAAKGLIDDLRREDYQLMVSEGGHYTLMTNIKLPGRAEEVRTKLEKLESIHSTFFYWFALKGQPRPMPTSRLVVVLVDTPSNNAKEFDTKHSLYNNVPLVGGGFTAQRENVVFASTRRLDEAFTQLLYNNQMMLNAKSLSMNALLNDAEMSKKHPEVSLIQTLAFVQRVMDEENENVTLSHEGIRQLVAATGLLPRNVATAEWARFGLASFFEMPHQAIYPSTGGPNWDQLIAFKYLQKANKIAPKNAKEILLKTVTDEYFRQAFVTLAEWQVNKDDRETLKEKSNEELELARATSWALMYYLVRNKSDQLGRYFQEINNLPRDLDYDAKVLKDCFYRAFGLLMVDPENPSRQMVDIGKLDTLAASWFSTIESTRLDLPKFEEDTVRARLQDAAQKAAAAAPSVQPSNQGLPGQGGFGQPKGGQGSPGSGSPGKGNNAGG